ncbi:MAG: Lrp/AsnC family transcriptional regulator [Gammaproteobacteria bacterium]|nr:Lrp/AsnC family transcriptional regulator [Gammaproteobacteria bacterium]
MNSEIELDDFDRRILRVLQDDADCSMAELGERVGLSHTPCWRRVKKLEAKGVIRGRVVLLDPERLHLTVNVFVEVRLGQQDEDTLNAFEAAVQSIDEIVESYTVSGEKDFLLRVVVADVASYEALLKKQLVHLPGVASLSSVFALRQVKYTTRLPL